MKYLIALIFMTNLMASEIIYTRKMFKDKIRFYKNNIEIPMDNPTDPDYQDFYKKAAIGLVNELIVPIKRYAAIESGTVQYVFEDHEEYPLPEGIDSKIEIIQSFNESLLAVNGEGQLYERAKTEEELDAEAKALIKQNIAKGKEIVEEVLFLNDKRQASAQVKLDFLANANVKQSRELLELGRLSLAKTVIQNTPHDETIITEDIKNKILDLLADY